jgi:hypothetical protein
LGVGQSVFAFASLKLRRTRIAQGRATRSPQGRSVVGEEVLELSNEVNFLQEGAGKTDALKVKGYFAPSPHRIREVPHGAS